MENTAVQIRLVVTHHVFQLQEENKSEKALWFVLRNYDDNDNGEEIVAFTFVTLLV